jgi:methylmalonyl-CoA mutase
MANSNLFKDFKVPTSQDWLAKIDKDLKGKALNQFINPTRDGIKVQPVYFAEGFQPKRQPLKEHPKWDVVQEILVFDVKKANKLALDHLNRGATSLLFYLQGHENLEQLLENIQIQFICLNLVTGSNPAGLADQLNDLIAQRGLEEVEIEGSLNFDPLENLARTGRWFKNEKQDFEALKNTEQKLQKGLRGVCVNANLFANAGATQAQQLGIALAMSYEYLYKLDLKTTRSFWVNVAVGSDYFLEIAKLRAMRRLWLQLQKELDLPELELRLYAETLLRNKTILGRYNNLIRSSAESMAAAVGGANEISVKGFNHCFEEPTFFGERIAKNQQNILQNESHLHLVRDMAQGSYFVESITEQLAAKGWSFFKAIEKEGGYLASLFSGWLQNEIGQENEKEQAAFDAGELTLIGANKYREEEEDFSFLQKSVAFRQKAPSETVVTPIVVSRLSEKLEKEILEG